MMSSDVNAISLPEGDHNEIEAIQPLNLRRAITNGKYLLWFKEWREQAAFTANLQRAF